MKYKIFQLLNPIIFIIAIILFVEAAAPLQVYAAGSYEYAVDNTVITVGPDTLHHFSDDGTCGATQYIGDYIDYEAFGGLKVHCHNTMIEYTLYCHTPTFKDGFVSIQKPDLNNTRVELGFIKENETKTIDLRSITEQMGLDDATGIYSLTLMSGEDYKEPARIYLYYNGSIVQTCRCNGNTKHDIDVWNSVIGGLDPKSCLDMWIGSQNNPITYPTSGTSDNCNHVKEWCDLSDEIIKNDDWSDELKVFALVCWMSRNLAYDNYRVNVLNNASRATNKGVWSDDSLWTYYNHVGQCWDFCNELVIMCRHHGISSTSVENGHHTVCAVWLHNEWTAIDPSVLVSRHCYKEDTAETSWLDQRDGNYRHDYGYFDSSMETYNQAIATPETTLFSKSGKNPM